jgi:hypothetical protein
MPPPSPLYSLICVLEGIGRITGHAARIKLESYTASVSACAGTTAASYLYSRPSVGNTTATRRQDGQTLEGEDGEARMKEAASALRTVSLLGFRYGD